MPVLSTVLRLAAVMTCLELLAGCQTLGAYGLVRSEVTAELTPEAATAIAADMIGRLAEHVGPGETTIELKANDVVFGPALEAALRGSGYAVVTNQASDGVKTELLAYVVDPFEGGVLVRLSTLRVELTRIYALGAGGASPASPLSVLRRGSDGAA